MPTRGAHRAPFVAITIKRKLRAAVERAFQALIDLRYLAVWLVPGGATIVSATMDPRVGGHFRIEGFLDDAPFLISGTCLAVAPPNRLTISWSFIGPSDPLRDEGSIITVDLEARGPTSTDLTLTHERPIVDDGCVLCEPLVDETSSTAHDDDDRRPHRKERPRPLLR